MTNIPQVLLITGAGSGMGQECALFLAGKGYRVIGSVFMDQEEAALQKAASERGVSVEIVRMDVTKPEQVAAVVQQVGRIDGLIYFAGLGLRGCVEDLGIDEVKRVFEVNFYGAINCVQAVLPGMRERRCGRLILTTSTGGRIGSVGIGGYASTKFALEGLAECLAQEVAMFDIPVSLLEPGLIQTPHFTVHRNRARRSVNPASPYFKWFCQHEKMVDDILARNTFTTRHVAETVYKILQTKKPLLRYIVGRNAALVINLRRYIPGEIFQRIQWKIVRRLITKPKVQALTFSGTEPAAGGPSREETRAAIHAGSR